MNLIKSNIDSLMAALLGAVIIIGLTLHSGLGISPDSIYYMSAADNFIAGKGFYQFDAKPFVMFPVFYPVAIAMVKFITGALFIKWAPVFNALLFGLAIFIAGLILQKSNINKFIKWAALLLLITSPSLLEDFTMLWSETLFISEIVLFFYVSSFYFEKNKVGALIAMALLAAIIADTRLAGVTIIATGGLLILLEHKIIRRKKIIHFLMFGFISISLFVINLIRNALVSSTLTGNRQKGVTPLLENLKYYGLVLSDWFSITKWLQISTVVMAIVFLVFIVMLFLLLVWKSKKQHYFEKVSLVFAFIYSIFMLAVATISRFETMNNRLLSPLFIPIVFVFVFFIMNVLEGLKNKWYKIAFSFFIIFIFIFTATHYFKYTLATYQENKQGGIGGYSDDDWLITSGLLNYLQNTPAFFKSNKVIFSNAAHAIYFKTGQQSQILPERKYLSLVHEFNKMPSQILVWFNNEDNPEVLTLAEVSESKNLQIIGKFNDGVIYLCTSK